MTCETEGNECVSNPCENGEHLNRFLCDCVGGFNGSTCEVDINECLAAHEK